MKCTDCGGESFRHEGDGIACRECNTWYSADDVKALERGQAPKGRYLSPADEKQFDSIEPEPLTRGAVGKIVAKAIAHVPRGTSDNEISINPPKPTDKPRFLGDSATDVPHGTFLRLVAKVNCLIWSIRILALGVVMLAIYVKVKLS